MIGSWHLISSNCNFEDFVNQWTVERLAMFMDSIMIYDYKTNVPNHVSRLRKHEI